MLRITVAAAAVLAACAGAQEALPPLRFSPGQTALFDVTSSTALGIGPAGASTELTLRCKLEVLEVDGDDTRLKITWQEVFGQVAIRFMTIRFDSTKEKDVETEMPDGGRLANWLGRSIAEDIKAPHLALRGFAYEVVVDEQGEPVEFPGLAAKLKALRAKVGKKPNAGMVRGFCTEEGLRWQTRLLVPVRARDPANVGATWDRKAVIGLGNGPTVRVGADVHHELKAIGDSRAEVEWSGEPTVSNDRVKVREGRLEGTAFLSTDDGLPLETEVSVELDVETRGLIPLRQKLGCDFEVVRIQD